MKLEKIDELLNIFILLFLLVTLFIAIAVIEAEVGKDSDDKDLCSFDNHSPQRDFKKICKIVCTEDTEPEDSYPVPSGSPQKEDLK